MPRRRRQNPDVSIPGQSARIGIRGSRYNIEREPDRVFVHGEEGLEREINFGGGEQHIHIHNEARQPAPQPAQHQAPRVNFDEIRGRMQEKVEHALEKHAMNLGQLHQAEFQPKWGGKAGIWRNLGRGPMQEIARVNKKWYAWHWLRAIGAAISRKKGRGAYNRERALEPRALEIRQRYGPDAARIQGEFRESANAALEQLRQEVAASEGTPERVGYLIRTFDARVKAAEDRFLARTYQLSNAIKAGQPMPP